ncbi:hypothetical protein RND71_035074 [Anisodus tanguticus]|uniref:MBD domain-containing protein n=1 Tax=Anisodus tanguticus TaxID=243964 RepID=A0AAE1R4T5_9SOLA|nr:hypothetical protein RND71_035074 [Anisodus tanguticus]
MVPQSDADDSEIWANTHSYLEKLVPETSFVHINLDILALYFDAQENQRNNISKSVLVPCGVSSHPMENVSRTTLSSTSTPHQSEEHNPLLLISEAIEQTMVTQNESEITPRHLTGRKRGLVNAEGKACTDVSFIIVPIKGEANIYTIELNKGEGFNDLFGLNDKYHALLHGWKYEMRKRPNGQCDKFYYHNTERAACRSVPHVRRYIFDGFEKLKVELDPETNSIKETKFGAPEQRSKKRKKESSSSKWEPAMKNQKSSTDKPSSSNVFMNVIHMEPLLKEGNNAIFANLDLNKIVPQYKENEEDKNEESACEISYNEAENDKEGVLCTTNFGLHEVAPEKKINNAKEGDITMLEDTHGKDNHLISHEKLFCKQREEVFVEWGNIADFDPYAHRGFVGELDNNIVFYAFPDDTLDDRSVDSLYLGAEEVKRVKKPPKWSRRRDHICPTPHFHVSNTLLRGPISLSFLDEIRRFLALRSSTHFVCKETRSPTYGTLVFNSSKMGGRISPPKANFQQFVRWYLSYYGDGKKSAQ